MALLIKNAVRSIAVYRTPNDMLSKYPNATYTTCRTFGQTSIVDLDTHLTRLGKVHELLKLPTIANNEISNFVMPSVKHAVHEFKKGFETISDKSTEVRLTIVVGSEEGKVLKPEKLLDLDVLVFGELLLPPRQPPVIVEVRDGVRPNPGVKSTDWAKERMKYQPSSSSIEEVILKEKETGGLFEGLSSNFGVLQDGKLITAPQCGVLPGVTLQLILRCCNDLSIPVVFENPNISNVHKWQGAFISSTSRMLMIIDVLKVMRPESNEVFKEYALPKHELLHKLRACLNKEVEKSAMPVFDE